MHVQPLNELAKRVDVAADRQLVAGQHLWRHEVLPVRKQTVQLQGSVERGSMQQEHRQFVALANQHIVGRKAAMKYVFPMHLLHDVHQALHEVVHELILCHNGQIGIQHLFHRHIVARLQLQLQPAFGIQQPTVHLLFCLYAVALRQTILQCIEEPHLTNQVRLDHQYIMIFVAYQFFPERSERHFSLSRIHRFVSIDNFFVVHFVSISYFVRQKYEIIY